MDYVQSVLLRSVEQSSLSVDVLVVQVQACLQQQLQTFLLPLTAYVEQDGLLVVVLEVRIGTMTHQQLHQLVRLLMVD